MDRIEFWIVRVVCWVVVMLDIAMIAVRLLRK